MKTKKDFIEYINIFQEWNEFWLYFIEKFWDELEKYNQTDIEHILDFLYSTKKKYKSIWIKTILEKANSWSKKLQEQASKKDNEIEWVDIKTAYDFWDWFKFVKLISEEAYNREWKLMSHCVASYFWRDVNIYSLRDKKNIPHCTIEENNQVKGKWNQTVDNKYFWYCIKFLEHMWFSIWENEMKNIWYYKLDKIDKDLQVDKKYLYDWKYISDKNLDKIKDKDWNKYYWLWVLNIKDLIQLKWEFNFNFWINITKTVKYLINTFKNASSWDYSKLASSWYNSKLASSW